MEEKYRICTQCIMDISDSRMTFDANGLCTHCRRFALQQGKNRENGFYTPEKLDQLLNAIKQEGAGRPYDCLLGVSGGIDSSYTAYTAHRLGLKPLCVHMDNGWNSELAVKNIEQIIRKLKFQLYTYVLDWEEFKDLQLAFLKASVVDVEMPTDHAILAVLYKIAAEKNIKYILSGGNIATEFVLPYSWYYIKKDALNILDIHRHFGTKRLQKFPLISEYQLWEYTHVQNIKFIKLLEYQPYILEEAIRTLQEKLGWRYYGKKHFESVFTRFYQGYILPVKFKIDKRRAHLSNLVISGQMSREQALEEIDKAPYSPEQLAEDQEFVLKKLGLSPEAFEAIMNLPVRAHTDFLCGYPPRK